MESVKIMLDGDIVRRTILERDFTDEDINDMLNLLTRMREKYGERYKDIIAVLYQLSEPNTKLRHHGQTGRHS